MEIDLAALQAEIGQLTPEEVAKQLLELRTKQKVQQKKYGGGGEKQKAYQKRKSEFNKLLAAKAKELGVYDQVVAEAAEKATQIVAAEKADEEATDEA